MIVVFLYGLLLLSMLFGQLGGIVISPGVVLYIHDGVCIATFIYAVSTLCNTNVRPKLLHSIGIFIGVGIVSLTLQFDRLSLYELSMSSLYLWRWALYAVGVYVYIVQAKISRSILQQGLFIYGTILALIGFLQFLYYPDLRNLSYLGWDPHYYRLFATFLDPNLVGIVLSFCVLLGVYLWQQERRRIYLLGTGILTLAVYLTYSRSSYLALTIGLIVYFLLQKKWRVILVVAIAIALLFLIPTPGGKTLRLTRWDSTISRIMNWQESFLLFISSPILGHGFNTLRVLQTPVSVKESGSFSRASGGVDSSIFFLLVTTGIVGLFAYGWVLYKAALIGNDSKKDSRLYQLFISTLAAVGAHSLFTNSLFYPWVMIWLWILIATKETTYDT